MTVTLNGKSREVDGSNLTVSEFVAALGIGELPVLVELNGQAVLTREFDRHRIEEGDTVEVVRMVAGG